MTSRLGVVAVIMAVAVLCGEPVMPPRPDGVCSDGSARFVVYDDADWDWYGAAGPSINACGQVPRGYSATPTDCSDADSRANPAATVFQHFPVLGRGGWDFNCDGVEALEATGYHAGCYLVLGDGGSQCLERQSPFGRWYPGDTIPTCGQSGRWVSSCRAIGAECFPEVISKTQGCL